MLSFYDTAKQAAFVGLLVSVIAIIAYYAFDAYVDTYGSSGDPFWGMTIAVFIAGAGVGVLAGLAGFDMMPHKKVAA